MSKAFEHFNLDRVESVCLGANFNNSQMVIIECVSYITVMKIC